MSLQNADIGVSIAVLGLQRAGRLTADAAAGLLVQWHLSAEPPTSLEHALELAHVRRSEVNGSIGSAADAVERGLHAGIVPIPMSSASYPPLLRRIGRPPPVIFVRGPAAVLAGPVACSVVGTRRATKHGRVIATRIGKYLCESGVAVVSGLALGIDAAAHEGALAGGGPTIAVLAHGLTAAHPSANRKLGEQILGAGGVWVSEHAAGVDPHPRFFLARNRIQVGLGQGSVLVEGDTNSGSANHARVCAHEGRRLFAVLPQDRKVLTGRALPELLVRSSGARALASRQDYADLVEALKTESEAGGVVS